MSKIICPNCHRILGDTHQNLCATINCKGCRKAVDVKVTIAPTFDYFNNKGDTNYDKSK